MAAPMAKMWWWPWRLSRASFNNRIRTLYLYDGRSFCNARKCYSSSGDTGSRSVSSSETSKINGSSGSFATVFHDMTQSRKHQASRSLLVRLSKNTPLDSLLQYCNSQGRVKHYFTYFQKQAHYVVVEFSSPDTVQQISQKAHNSDGRPGSQHSKDAAETRFLSFSRPLKQREKKLEAKEEPTILNKDLSSSELLFSIAQAKTVDEQLELLVRKQELRDAETRLRFLACSLMEEAFQRILPDATLHPFGSSVNGFGKRSCDVDMYLDRGTAQGVVPQKQGRNTYKLSYDRQSAHSERAATQSTLFTLAEFLERHVPQCSFVTRILRARCPLVKFKHQATGLACDLTGDNRIALKSSEMLYIYGHLDPRVRPLVFMVRHWARLNGITHSNPGYWITNYPLTLLVLFFLQTRPEPVLPALSKIAMFEPALEGMEEEEKDVELVFSNAPHIPACRNTETPTELLREFFHFCASFPFEKYALSVHHGSTYLKPVTGKALPLYIENPLELELNTCKNVTGNLVDRLRRLSREALKTMDQLDFYQCDGDSSRVHSWGLGTLLVGSVHGKGRKRSAAMEKKLGAMFKALGKRDYSTYPYVDSWWHRSLCNGHRPR